MAEAAIIQDSLDLGDKAMADGNRQTARQHYRQALENTNSPQAAVKYAEATFKDDPDEAVKTLEAQPPDIDVLRSLVVHKEWRERMRNGQMPYHCPSIEELFFAHAKSALRRFTKEAEKASAYDLAMAKFVQGDGSMVEQIALTMPKAKRSHVASTVRVSRPFFENIDSPIYPFNEVEGTEPAPGPVIWLGCDSNYLPFAVPMIKSLQAVAPNVALHLHCFDKEVNIPGASTSWENSPLGPVYYHAARLVRVWEFMQEFDRAVWMMDVDALFRTSPAAMMQRLDGHDVCLRARPGRLEPWNQLNASVVGFNNTDRGRAYLKTLSEYIQFFHARHRLAWGIDQAAMYGAYTYHSPDIVCLNDREVDYDYHADGVVWCNSSARKFLHLQGKEDADRDKYVQLFRKYQNG